MRKERRVLRLVYSVCLVSLSYYYYSYLMEWKSDGFTESFGGIVEKEKI